MQSLTEKHRPKSSNDKEQIRIGRTAFLGLLLAFALILSYIETLIDSSKDSHSQRPQRPPSLQTARGFLLFQHVGDPPLSTQARGETQNKERTHFLYLVRDRFGQQGSWLILIGVASNLFRHWLVCIG